MKKLFIGVVAMATTLFVGCGQSFYPTDNHNLVATNVNISEANFRVVGLVEGRAKATYILGIGGLSGKALRSNAYSDMVRNANLTGSQMIVNATISKNHYGFVPFRWTQMVKYQGTVIEFINPNQTASIVNDEPKVQPTTNVVKTSKVAPSAIKEEMKASKGNEKKQVKIEKVRKIEEPAQTFVTKSISEEAINEIDSMSKSKRKSYLSDLISRLDRLCSRRQLIEDNRGRIDDLMARLQYILEHYNCGKAAHKSYEKYVEELSK